MRSRCIQKASSSVCPLSLVSAIRQCMPIFRGYRQHDAQEFLRYFLDRIHWEESQIDKPSAIVSHLFQGLLQSEVTCLKCHQKHVKIEPFLDLSLDIPMLKIYLQSRPRDDDNEEPREYQVRNYQLQDCLRSFTCVEYLGENELYFCDTCASREQCTKTMQIQKLPKVSKSILSVFRSFFANARTPRCVFFISNDSDLSWAGVGKSAQLYP